MVPITYSGVIPTRYSDRLLDFSVTIGRYYKDIYLNSFFIIKIDSRIISLQNVFHSLMI